MIKVKTVVGFQTTMLGSRSPGDVFECKPSRAAQLIAEGYCEPYEVKEIKKEAHANMSASQVGQALPKQTATESKRGGKPKKTAE